MKVSLPKTERFYYSLSHRSLSHSCLLPFAPCVSIAYSAGKPVDRGSRTPLRAGTFFTPAYLTGQLGTASNIIRVASEALIKAAARLIFSHRFRTSLSASVGVRRSCLHPYDCGSVGSEELLILWGLRGLCTSTPSELRPSYAAPSGIFIK